MKTDSLAGLMPLAPPPPPVADPTLWIALGLLLVIVLLGAGLGWNHPRRRRLRRLCRLERQLAAPGSDTAALAAETERLLQAFAPPGPLRAGQAPAAVEAAHWQALVEALHAARFGAETPAGAQLAALLLPVRQQLANARGRT